MCSANSPTDDVPTVSTPETASTPAAPSVESEITDPRTVVVFAILLAYRSESFGLRLERIDSFLNPLSPDRYLSGAAPLRPTQECLNDLSRLGYITLTSRQVGTAGSRDTFYKLVEGQFALRKL